MGTLSKDSTSYVVNVGIDVGQTQDPTAVVVTDPEVRDKEIHYVVRFLKRLPLGLPYPSIVKEILRIYDRIPGRQTKGSINKQVWIDATGVGKPVTDLIRQEIPGIRLHEVYITGGEIRESIDTSAREIKLPKAYLVSRLQVLLSYGRVHLPTSDEALALKQELMDYQIKVNENANAEFGAFRVGAYDDLVTALGLACLRENLPGLPLVVSAGSKFTSSRETSRLLKGFPG